MIDEARHKRQPGEGKRLTLSERMSRPRKTAAVTAAAAGEDLPSRPHASEPGVSLFGNIQDYVATVSVLEVVERGTADPIQLRNGIEIIVAAVLIRSQRAAAPPHHRHPSSAASRVRRSTNVARRGANRAQRRDPPGMRDMAQASGDADQRRNSERQRDFSLAASKSMGSAN
jgi:hypothetical protein